MEHDTARGRDRARTWVRGGLYALAATLLVIAAILLYVAYADDVRFALSQHDLAATFPAREETASAAATPTLDFAGWGEQDAAFWRALKVGDAFGRIVAPDAGVDDIIVKGAGQPQLAKGPGWITQTDLPGPEGNCGISGHRVTHGHPFRRLDRLKLGATIDLYSPFRRYRYIVVRILRVTPDHVEVVAHTASPQLTLTTCDPPGRAVRRLVVQARLVEVTLLSASSAGL